MEIERYITSVEQVYYPSREKTLVYNSIKIESLEQILATEPFVRNVYRAVATDLDGVICTTNSVGNYGKIKDLGRVITASNDFAVYSARYCLPEGGLLEKTLKPILRRRGQAVMNYPFFDKESGDSLERFIKARNPNCSVSLVIGGEKLRRCNKAIVSMANNALEKDGVFVFIGSGLIDKRNVGEIAKEMGLKDKNTRGIYYLYTGKGLI